MDSVTILKLIDVPFHCFYCSRGDIKKWNVHTRDTDRTSNCNEAFHSRLNSVMQRANPNVFTFLYKLREIQVAINQSYVRNLVTRSIIFQADCYLKRQQHHAGQKVKKFSKQYQRVQQQINHLKENYETGMLDCREFLRQISFQMARYKT